MSGLLLVLLFLVLLSALFSGSESALFSLDASALESRLKSASEKAALKIRKYQQWMALPERTITALLLGNLAVNIAISEAGDIFIVKLLGADTINISLISLFSITLFLLIFGEIIPKMFGLILAESWLNFWFSALRLWFIFARYAGWPFYYLARSITRLMPAGDKVLHERELMSAIHLAEEYGLLNTDEKSMLNRSVSFYHDTVYSAMVPISEVFIIPAGLSTQKAKKLFLEEKRRIAIVINESNNQPSGYLHVRGLSQAIFKKQKSIRTRIQKLLVLPETLPLKDGLQKFKTMRSEVAAVVDESGMTTGIITMKDILGRLFGDFGGDISEPDSGEAIETLPGGVYRVNGDLSIDIFNEKFRTKLHSNESETMAGFIMEYLDGFPFPGTKFICGKLEFSGIKLKEYRIESFLVRKS